jgi:hypothetical protein
MDMKIWAVVAVNLAAASAYAQPCGELDDMDAQLACYDRYAKCAGITSDAKRLACYQEAPTAVAETQRAARTGYAGPAPKPVPELVPQAVAQPAVAPAAESVVESVPVPGPVTVPEPAAEPTVAADDEVFPVRGKPSPREAAPAQISAAITRVRKNPQGIVYLDLDNGQVWKETTRSKFRYKPGLQVTISEGSLGSTNLRAEGMRTYAKVVRVN